MFRRSAAAPPAAGDRGCPMSRNNFSEMWAGTSTETVRAREVDATVTPEPAQAGFCLEWPQNCRQKSAS